MGCEQRAGVELVCIPSAIPASERGEHLARARDVFHVLAEERQDLPNGYGLRFAPDAFEAVARFVANERKCCPFASFEFTVAADGGPIWLRITGPSGTREVLQAELNVPAACGCL